jgi:hypothetical protein
LRNRIAELEAENARLQRVEAEARELLHALPGWHPELHEAIYGPDNDDE